MNMKRVMTCALSALMVLCIAFATTGCGGGKRDENTLTVYIYQQETEQDIYEQLAGQFQDAMREQLQNPSFTVKLTFGGGADYFTKLKSDATAKTLPDIIYVRPGDVRQYVKTGLIKNLSEMVEEEDLSGIWDNAIDFFRFDTEKDENGTGDIYALPKDYSQYLLGYSTDILDVLRPYVYEASTSVNYEIPTNGKAADATAGAKPTGYADWTGKPLDIYNENGTYVRTDLVKLPGLPGKKIGDNYVVYTFEEFGYVGYLATKRDNDNKIVTGDARRMGTGMWEEMCLMAYVWGNGAEFLKENNRKSNITDPKFVEAYQQFLDLRYKYYSNNGSSENDPFEDFGAGKLSICPVGTWDFSYFANRFAARSATFDLMPWPCTAEGDTGNSLDDVLSSRQTRWKARADSVGYGISRDSTNEKVAMAFIQYLTINEDVQKELASKGAQIPNLKAEAQNFVNGGTGYNFVAGYPGKDSRALLLRVADTTANGNGHFGPTVSTYNDEWFSSGFLGEIGLTTATSGRKTAKEYCEYIDGEVQRLLDRGWQDESEVGEGCGSTVIGDIRSLGIALGSLALGAVALGLVASRGKKKQQKAE